MPCYISALQRSRHTLVPWSLADPNVHGTDAVSCGDQRVLLLEVLSPFRRLAIIRAIFTFETAALNNSLLLHPNHSLRFFSHEFRLLPMDLFPWIFPCIMICNIRYFSPLKTCPIYCNFLLCIVGIISLSLCIRLITSTLVTLSTHEIFSTLRYIHISNASNLLMSILFRVQASIP